MKEYIARLAKRLIDDLHDDSIRFLGLQLCYVQHGRLNMYNLACYEQGGP